MSDNPVRIQGGYIHNATTNDPFATTQQFLDMIALEKIGNIELQTVTFDISVDVNSLNMRIIGCLLLLTMPEQGIIESMSFLDDTYRFYTKTHSPIVKKIEIKKARLLPPIKSPDLTIDFNE